MGAGTRIVALEVESGGGAASAWIGKPDGSKLRTDQVAAAGAAARRGPEKHTRRPA